MLIVESIDGAKRRQPVGGRERVTALNEVSIYTDDNEDTHLLDVFESMRKKENGNTVSFDPRKASKEELFAYMQEVLPNYDHDRVYATDVKKLIQWYNILVTNGITDFADPKQETKEASEAAGE